MIYTLDEIARRIRPVAEKYHLQAVYIFGSYARGEAREDSDVDLLVDTSGSGIETLLQLAAVYCDLEEILNKQIDLITADSLEQEPSMPSDRYFRQNIQRERVNLYAAA